MNKKQQNHLEYIDRVNLGAYYTQEKYVDLVWDMLSGYLDKEIIVMDTSCGYGNFLSRVSEHKKIGNNIDLVAIRQAKSQYPPVTFLNVNALKDVSRQQYHIKDKAKLALVGNPPYNDRTSIIRNHIKSFNVPIDSDILTRDLGMSFLLSYQKLKADHICVLHPLSYLIKQANFNLLKKFSQNYQLIEGKIISSGVFSQSSKVRQFPIVIALYQRNDLGMNYDYIKDFSFHLAGGSSFKLNDFDYISRYIKKYPHKYAQADAQSILFWTMREHQCTQEESNFCQSF